MGRTDAESGETSPKECGLPDADKGSRKNTIQHVRDVFYRKCTIFLKIYYVVLFALKVPTNNICVL